MEEEENQNRADENSPDNASGNVIPMSETLRLAGFCREVAETARDMHRFCKKALKFFDHVDTPFEDKKTSYISTVNNLKREMEEMIIRSEATALTLSIQRDTLAGWLEKAENGNVLNVFTDDGMQNIVNRLNESKDKIKEVLDYLNQIG